MNRAIRVWHRGWLRKAISVFSFGWYPASEIPASTYIVTADAECFFAGLAHGGIMTSAFADSALYRVGLATVTIRTGASADSAIRSSVTRNAGLL